MTPYTLEIRPETDGYSIHASYGMLRYSNGMLSHWFIGDAWLAAESYEELRALMYALRQIRLLLRDQGREGDTIPIITVSQGEQYISLWNDIRIYTLPVVFTNAREIDGILLVLQQVEERLGEVVARNGIEEVSTTLVFA